jgi:acyl dehydratase
MESFMTVTIPGGIELTPAERLQIDALYSKIGTKLDDVNPLNAYRGQTPFFTEANVDAILHYALGIDDLNPMWTDPAYAKESCIGTVVAPPSFLFPVAPGGMSGSQFFGLGEMFGEHETWGGADLRWHRWIKLGTKISTETRLKDVAVKRSRLSGMLLQLTGESRYFDQEGNLLAESDSWIFRKRKYQYGTEVSTIELQKWTREEVDALRARKESEKPRGPEPRFWEDVKEGETFGLLKGPYSMMSNYCYLSLWHPTHMWRGDVPWADLDSRPPGPLGFPDVQNPHYDATAAHTKGLPGAFDYGPQRHSWSSQLMTNWMGDDGFLEGLSFRVIGFNFIGDIQDFTGTVAEKYVEDGRHLVRCAIDARNQRGAITGDGSAIVRLPAKGRNG